MKIVAEVCRKQFKGVFLAKVKLFGSNSLFVDKNALFQIKKMVMLTFLLFFSFTENRWKYEGFKETKFILHFFVLHETED